MNRIASRTLRKLVTGRAAAVAAVGALLGSLAVPALAHPPDAPHPAITPASVDVVLAPGGSIAITKTVHTPEIAPEPEIYFLVDTTGSMGPVIAQVQAEIATIIGSIQTAAPGATFGLGEYRDFPNDVFAFNHRVSIGPDDGPGGAFDVSDDIAGLAAGGGGDGSEGQFFALDQLADAANPAGFSGSKTAIIVWIGDAPGHDPVCSAISGLAYDIDEASTTAKLQAPAWSGMGLRVVAISTLTGFPAGLDDDPALAAGDYAASCVIDGTAGQATRIAGATGGTHLTGVAPADIADAILTAVGAVQVEVSMESGCVAPISTTFAPASLVVTSGDDAVFTETISVAADAEPGVYVCRDVAFIDGRPLLGPDREVIFETKRVVVAVPFCVETLNPAGRNVPRAPGNGGQGQNQDGFYEIGVEPAEADAEVFVVDGGTGMTFGPFPSGTRIKYTQAPDVTPSMSPMGGNNGNGGQAGAVDWHIKGQGDAFVLFEDGAGNMVRAACLVPPPPK